MTGLGHSAGQMLGGLPDSLCVWPLRAGEPCWIRTSDLLIKSQLLYQLS